VTPVSLIAINKQQSKSLQTVAGIIGTTVVGVARLVAAVVRRIEAERERWRFIELLIETLVG
jgi:hypothetical protein